MWKIEKKIPHSSWFSYFDWNIVPPSVGASFFRVLANFRCEWCKRWHRFSVCMSNVFFPFLFRHDVCTAESTTSEIICGKCLVTNNAKWDINYSRRFSRFLFLCCFGAVQFSHFSHCIWFIFLNLNFSFLLFSVFIFNVLFSCLQNSLFRSY